MPARIRPAAAAARIGVALLGAAVALAGCGSGHHETSATTTPPASTASTAGTTAPPSTSTSAPGAGSYDWTRDASATLAIGGGASSTLAAVLPGAATSPWLIAGTRLSPDGASTATVWTSADGTGWQAAALTGPQVDSQAEAATRWRAGTVVVGSVGSPADRRAAVWISPGPGDPFTEISSAALLSSDSTITSVTSGTLGLFAAGTTGGRVALWYSTNGRRWANLSGAERVIDAANDPHVDTLLATTTQGVYAAGWVHNGTSMAAAVWSSGDGINWHQVLSAQESFAEPGDHLITALAQLTNGSSPLGAGLVAVGGTWTGSRWSPASWISPNGASWSQASTDFALGARPGAGSADAVVRALAAVPTAVSSTASLSTTLIAVGGGPTAQRLWESTDGLRWGELPLPSGAALSDQWHATMLAVAGSTVAVADGDPGQPHLLIKHGQKGWAQPSADPLVFGAVQSVARPTGLVATPDGLTMAVSVDDPGQVLGPGRSATELLVSRDGTTWSTVPTGTVFAAATVTGLTTVPGLTPGTAGLVAVGRRQVGSQVRAEAWTSPDGTTWEAGVPLDARPEAGPDAASRVCSSGADLVAVGSAGGVARAWVSPDGKTWAEARVAPAGQPAAFETMAGCSASPTGETSSVGGSTSSSATTSPSVSSSPVFEAFGSAASPGTGVGPAYWVSTGGASWTRQAASPFGPTLPFPIVDIARTGSVWLATTSAPDPALGSAPSGGSTLWLSSDAGSAWQRVNTTSATWQGVQPPDLGRVALLGATPVVAGAVDGRLTVWVGVPA